MHFQSLQWQGTESPITGFTAAMPRGHTTAAYFTIYTVL